MLWIWGKFSSLLKRRDLNLLLTVIAVRFTFKIVLHLKYFLLTRFSDKLNTYCFLLGELNKNSLEREPPVKKMWLKLSTWITVVKNKRLNSTLAEYFQCMKNFIRKDALIAHKG